MGRQITVSCVDSISKNEDICHFDELSDPAKDTLTQLVRDETTIGVGADVATELVTYDVIKFIDYLRVSYAHSTASSSISA